MKWILAVFVALFPLSATAQQIVPVTSTPDNSITATATKDFYWDKVPGNRVDWIYLKNDCSAALWFDFRSKRDAVTRQYPLKLAQNQSFQAFMQLYSVGVSPANSGTACTFTMMGGLKGP